DKPNDPANQASNVTEYVYDCHVQLCACSEV
ncbi:unnamed protein product, partial [Rotaria sordida]